MKSIITFLTILTACIILSGCGTLNKVSPVDPVTGYLPSSRKATIVISKLYPLPQNIDALVPGARFVITEQIDNLGVFRKVYDSISFDQMLIEKKAENIGASSGTPIGWKSAAGVLDPFLVILTEGRGSPLEYWVIKAYDPKTAEVVFMAEIKIPKFGGVTDENTIYSVYNALIEWINKNKKA